MSYGAQMGIPDDVLHCVRRMHDRLSDSRYRGQEHEILSRAVETSEDILHKYQAYGVSTLNDQLFFLNEYVQWIREKIEGVKRYNLAGILMLLRALVKIFNPEEKKKSPPGNNEELAKLQSKINKLEKSLHEERVAKDDLYQRLSKVAADRMKTGNPEIADLSDQNRPMKLAEKFNELYSSAWSDAYEWLQKIENNSSSNSTSNNSAQQPRRKPDSKKEDEDTTQILFEALKSCYEWSLKAADCQRGAIIKAGIGNIDFDTNHTNKKEVNQGPASSDTSQERDEAKNSAGNQQRPSSGQKPYTRTNEEASVKFRITTSKKEDEQPKAEKLRGSESETSSRAGNQGFGSSMISSPHEKTQTSRGDSQRPSPQEFQSSRAGNQGFGSSMTSSPHEKTQTSRGDSQRPSPQEFQSSRAGNQGFGSSMTSSPHEKTQTSREDTQRPSPQEFQAGGENASVKQADKAKAKEEEKESSTLDSPAKEFMRCAGVESVKRLPEKICQKVMEDKTYHDIEAYVQKCAELCWLMRIQFPPIELLFDIKPNGDFDHKYHKPYTSSGEKIAFPVWPTMLLHKDGPVLSMGVVQCKKK